MFILLEGYLNGSNFSFLLYFNHLYCFYILKSIFEVWVKIFFFKAPLSCVLKIIKQKEKRSRVKVNSWKDNKILLKKGCELGRFIPQPMLECWISTSRVFCRWMPSVLGLFSGEEMVILSILTAPELSNFRWHCGLFIMVMSRTVTL